MKLVVLVCLAVSVSSFAEDSKIKVNGVVITKEQHMAADAACRATKADIRGAELKACIKQKLGIKDQ